MYGLFVLILVDRCVYRIRYVDILVLYLNTIFSLKLKAIHSIFQLFKEISMTLFFVYRKYCYNLTYMHINYL